MKREILKKSFSVVLSLVLLASSLILSPSAFAAGDMEVTFGKVQGKIGEEVTVPVSVKNNPGISTFLYDVSYDPEGLAFLSAQAGSVLNKGQLFHLDKPNEKKITLMWYSVEGDVIGDGELVLLKFKILDTAKGNYSLNVAYQPDDIQNENNKTVESTAQNGEIFTGCTVSGTITSFGKVGDAVTVTLKRGEETVATQTTQNGSYSLESIAPGNYQLVVSKPDHATRVYDLTVGTEDLNTNVKICLFGDVTGDGQVKIGDYAKILAHVRGTSPMTGYELLCADVTGDKDVKIGDYAKVLAHVRGTSNLW